MNSNKTHELIQIGTLNTKGHELKRRIYSEEGICPSVISDLGSTPKILVKEEDMYITNGAIRGRYNANGKVEQRLELRDDEITNTLTTVEKDNVIVERGDIMSDPKLVGGVGEINFGKQYRQGNRIYDSEEIAMCLMSQPVGNTGGFSYLYQIDDNNLIKRENENMWKNELEKFEFKMDSLRVFDTFSGKGALHKSLSKLGVPLSIIGLSEIEPDAIIAYAAIHIDDFLKLEFIYPSEQQMRNELMSKNIGWDFMKQKSSIPRMKKDKLSLLYKADKLLNNLGDISQLNYKNIPDFDLMNFSFPCTDLSLSGKQKGLTNEDGSHTRSGLVKFGLEVIKVKTPKYIMIENVKGLISSKFVDNFYSIVEEIESLGYKCYYPTKKVKKILVPTCINAKNYGIPQSRDRIFVICVRNDIKDSAVFPKGFDSGIRLKHLLEDTVDEKYYIKKANNINMKDNYIQYDNSGKGYESQAARLYYSDSSMGSLPFRNGGDKTQIVEEEKFGLDASINGTDYNPEINNFRIRKLTPLECFRLMGFDDEDFYKTKETGLSDSSLYRLAGNSIVVNCLYYIFKELFKDYIVKGEKND